MIDATERRGIDTGALLPPGSLGLWYDYRTEHAERLTFAVALAAASAGAVLANYVDAIEPIREGRTVAGIVARDSVDGAALRITAHVTINATGAAAGRLMAAFGVRSSPPLVKAMNLVTTRPAPEDRVRRGQRVGTAAVRPAMARTAVDRHVARLEALRRRCQHGDARRARQLL